VKGSMISEEWKEPDSRRLTKHKLLFHAPFSESKLKFALFKGMTQHYLGKYLGKRIYSLVGKPYTNLTDDIYKILN
jgi:hypothetical protein